MRLSDVNTGELAGFQNELMCCFILAADMVEGGMRVVVNNTDETTFLERELKGLGLNEHW